MFDVAGLISDATRDVERRDAAHSKTAALHFNASFIFGGQIKGEAPRLFRSYAETNFILEMALDQKDYAKQSPRRFRCGGSLVLGDGVGYPLDLWWTPLLSQL